MNILFQHSFQRSFGTYPLQGKVLHDTLNEALKVGYRAFDTAQMYGNEAAVGAVLANSGIPRQSLLITTKVMAENFSPKRFLPSVEESLRRLQVQQIDLLLLHWPPADGIIDPSLQLLEQALQQGLTQHIGVSNYTAAMMRRARQCSAAPLVTNQVEFHPLLNQDILLATAIETGIPLSSYCSVARGEINKYPLLAEIGQGYGKSAAQVALRWILQKGVAINSMSTKPANIAANFHIMDFTLSNIDMARIEALTKTGYRIVNADLVPTAPNFD